MSGMLSRGQWLAQQQIRDRLAVWAQAGWFVRWVTFSSAGRQQWPTSRSLGSICDHWKAMRRRWERHIGAELEYCCVRTSDGYGLHHLLVACDPKMAKHKGYVSQRRLSRWWRKLHGAQIVWISKVDCGEESRAKLLHANRLKNGIPSVHPLRGPELRALRKIVREYPETPMCSSPSGKGR